MHAEKGILVFAQLNRICTTGRPKFPRVLSSRSGAAARRTTRGKRAEVSAALFLVPVRRLNPPECRTRRDPLFTDRSSTRPCGRSRSGTRTCPRSAPEPTDPYGKQRLQSGRTGLHHPRRPVRVHLPAGCSSIRSSQQQDRAHNSSVYVLALWLLGFGRRVVHAAGSLAFLRRVGIIVGVLHICFALRLGSVLETPVWAP